MSKKVALLIGVSEYGEGIPSLSAPLNDVAAMKRVLENPHMGGFDEVTTRFNPDLPAMQKAVQQIFANCRKDDLVLLFFSGHGITDDNNRLYLATKGTSKDYYKATSVPASFIQDVSLESYAKRQVIVLDCCYSGAFAEGWQTKSVGIELEKELGAEGRVVLTSATATQTSFQQEGEELSLYTQYLVEGMETGAADKDEDGKIHAHELHDYAKAKVQEVKPKQKPGIIIDREGFNILISQAPVNDPELDFRKLVEKYATEGQITVAGNYILQVKRQELGITEEKSDEIINEVLAPYRKRIENIKLYKQVFTEAVKQNYPLTERLLNELKDLEDVLGLEDKDIARVKEQIMAEKEAEYRPQQEVQQQEQKEYQNKLQRYEQEFLKAVEQEYPLSENARNQINILQQSLGLRTEDIKRIEQPILAAKDWEKQKAEKNIITKPPQKTISQYPNSFSTSQPQKKLTIKIIAGIAVLIGGVSVSVNYLISNQTNEQPRSVSTIPEEETLKLNERQVDNLVQTLQTQYQEQKYQHCYDLAMDKILIDKNVMSEWVGKCGLEAAKIKANDDSYSGAISIAQKIPNTASNYQEVQGYINLWSEKILEYATKVYKKGKLEDAIYTVETFIPDNSSAKNKIPDLISQWQQEEEKHQTIINNAQQALEQEKWQNAKQEAEKISSDFVEWKKQAQAIINRANLEINRIALEKSKLQKARQQVSLISITTGVDYNRLHELLKAEKWKEADLETTRAIFQAAGREEEESLRKQEHIDNFSCEDLRIIDQLWLEFSQGKFGFSVQKEIYQNLGGTRDDEVMNNFGDSVGWRKGGEWLILNHWGLGIPSTSLGEIDAPTAPRGQFPTTGYWHGGRWGPIKFPERAANCDL